MLAAVARAQVDEIVVVEGAHELQVPPGVTLVRCDDWAVGPGASLRCGLAPLGEDVTRAVVVLADGPNLDPRAIDRLLERTEPFLAASYDGTRSHPVVLARSAWSLVPNEGGRAVEPVLVDCSDLTPPGDVDYRR